MSDKIQASRYFTHYAAQWRRIGGTWEHFEMEGGLLAIFKTEKEANACLESIGQIEHVETRAIRYHTSGYVDLKDAPPLMPVHMWDKEEEPPTRQEKARRAAKAREVEVIDE